MKIEKLSLLVESIGTLAIIVSLIFVAFQVQENTRASYAASYDSIAVSQIDWRMQVAANPELLEDWGEFLVPFLDPNLPETGLKVPELNANSLLLEALLLNYERAFYARKYGRLGDEEWARYARSMCMSASMLPLALEANFTPDFLNFIRECAGEQENSKN